MRIKFKISKYNGGEIIKSFSFHGLFKKKKNNQNDRDQM